MDRRLLGVTTAGGGLAVGLAVGLLVARRVDAEWFEAVGTWLGVVVSTTAVILAVMVFRSEEFARYAARMRQEAAEVAATKASRNREKALAEAIQCEIQPAVGGGLPDGRTKLTSVRVVIRNRTSNHTATDVGATSNLLFGDSEDFRPMCTSLPAGGVHTQEIELLEPLTVGRASADELLGTADFAYSLEGVRWSQWNGSLPERL